VIKKAADVKPDFSVLIPARNEGGRIALTIQSAARARATSARVEFIVVDDASTDDCVERLTAAVPLLLQEPSIDIRVCRLEQHSGNYRARNTAALLASADILFITDAHVRFCHGWDEKVLEHIRPNRILAGTITQEGSSFKGYGCSLMVPLMGTSWRRAPVEGIHEVPIAVCAATAMPRDLFESLGGYDEGMIHYGGGEPEFSVRSWLHGAEIHSVPDLEIQHEFKPRQELGRFLESIRPRWVHNLLRFGLLYLSELGCTQLLRFHALRFPHVFAQALSMIDASDVWERRKQLEQSRKYSFEWFVHAFDLRNQIGGEIL
jgi:glycosyltransferase involved in cell wall biosynthesis